MATAHPAPNPQRQTLRLSPATAESASERRRQDRRRSGTPMWSRYTLVGGRRRGGRRQGEDHGTFVDQHGAALFAVVLAIVALNVLDAWFTMFFLSYGGTELNPVVQQVLDWGVWPFVALKSLGIGLCVAFLALTKNFRSARIGMAVVLLGYIALLCWHLHLLDWLDL